MSRNSRAAIAADTTQRQIETWLAGKRVTLPRGKFKPVVWDLLMAQRVDVLRGLALADFSCRLAASRLVVGQAEMSRYDQHADEDKWVSPRPHAAAEAKARGREENQLLQPMSLPGAGTWH
jgi:hypothetical protein